MVLGKELATEGPGETLASAVRASALPGHEGLGWIVAQIDLAQLDNPHPTAETTHKPPATPKAQLSSGCVVIGDRDVSSLGWMFFGTAAVYFHFSVFDA